MVRIHTKDDKSIEGVLVSRGAVYVLHAASVWQDEESSVTVGQASVPRQNVSFYQVLA